MIHKLATANYCIFKNYIWPASLGEFKDYNLIYGWNGSGKTTLSNFFRCIQQQEANGQSFTFQRGDYIIDSKTLATDQSLPQVRVYNRCFVDDNVFTSHKGVTPIFFIGEDSIEIQREIEELKQAEGELQKAWSYYNTKTTTAKTELEKHCQVFGGNVKRLLTTPGEKTVYNNYNKSSAIQGFEILLKDELPEEMSASEENSLVATVRSKILNTISTFPSVKIDLSKELTETLDLLSSSVVSEAIDRFKKDGDLNEWAKLGADIQNRVGGNNCIFCDQPYPQNFLSELEGHFDDSFSRFVEKLDTAIMSLESRKEALDISLPDSTRLYEELRAKYESELIDYDYEKQLAAGFIGELISILRIKKKNPFETVAYNATIPNENLESRVSIICSILKEHNTITEDFEQRIKSTRKALERNELLKGVKEYKILSDSIVGHEREAEEASKNLREVRRKISSLEDKITESKRPAEEINADLIAYLGRDDIRFENKDAGYQILRNGKEAEALSEGERAGIAFTYFIKSLEDKDFDLEKGVVVIDDPVSSLDTNALFYAFGFMKARTEKAGQLFVLTHNYSFFRQVKNWFKKVHQYKKKLNRDASFYMLKCIGNTCDRESSLEELDSLLRNYESDYHYLFKLVYEHSKMTDTALSTYYHLPNIVRRLLEAFLAFRIPNDSGLRVKLKAVNFDESKKTRILHFLHTHSHRDHIDDLQCADVSILSEAPNIVQDVIDLMRAEDERHVAQMLAAVC